MDSSLHGTSALGTICSPTVALNQPGQHDTVAAGATLVGNLELVTTLAKDGAFSQPVKRTVDRCGAGVRYDLEAASHQWLDAEIEAQGAAAQVDGAASREL